MVSKHVLIDSKGEWPLKFNQLCKNYGIKHINTLFFSSLDVMVWLKLVKTLKHGLITLFIIVEHSQDCDNHLPKI